MRMKDTIKTQENTLKNRRNELEAIVYGLEGVQIFNGGTGLQFDTLEVLVENLREIIKKM